MVLTAAAASAVRWRKLRRETRLDLKFGFMVVPDICLIFAAREDPAHFCVRTSLSVILGYWSGLSEFPAVHPADEDEQLGERKGTIARAARWRSGARNLVSHRSRTFCFGYRSNDLDSWRRV